MKKLYVSNKFKAYNEKRSESALKNKKRQETLSKDDLLRKAKRRNKRQFITIEAPPKFSIKDNLEECLDLFAEIETRLWNKERLFIDLSNVHYLTTDVLIYLLSRLDFFEQQGRLDVAGNLPNDPDCEKIISASGFYDYMSFKPSQRVSNQNILSIKSGSIVQPQVAKEVVNFSLKHLKKDKSLNSMSIYTTLIECMANTKNHAYHVASEKISKWWLIALYSKNDNSVKFTFLDNGHGIPKTVRKKVLERLISYEDNKLIESALKGNYLRTQTNQPWRGNGLPKIYNFSKEKQIEDLVVISNKGCINCEADESKLLGGKRNLNGTLLSWSFV